MSIDSSAFIPTEPSPDDSLLVVRDRVLQHLRDQGFKLADGGILVPVADDKDALRKLHDEAVASQRERAKPALKRLDERFLFRLSAGDDIVPERVRPRMVLLEPGQNDNSRLWRWASLHWSIPVSSGYGRRLRFLVLDEGHNDAVMGLIGLADPVFSLAVRDSAIGWTAETRKTRLSNVMDAFVLGSVPPYSQLLGGKLIASLVQSDEVRDAFEARYGSRTTLISGRNPEAKLALVTTSSALGKSSVYNRVRREDGGLAMTSIGFTKGSGDFHFSGAIYDELAALALKHLPSTSTHRHENWGTGFRNRREVVQRALRILGLNPTRMRLHGIRREVFMSPLAANSYAWLRGDDDDLFWISKPASEIAQFWKTRWMLPRAASNEAWSHFDRESWRLYPENPLPDR